MTLSCSLQEQKKSVSLLCRACISGDIHSIKKYLSSEIVNAKNEYGWNPLQIASVYGYKDVTELLISADCDLIARDDDGNTPLHLAADQGHLDIVKLILNKAHLDMDVVNQRSNSGCTALHMASVWGHTDVVNYLISIPTCDIDAKDADGCTPLRSAVYEKHGEIAKLLLAAKCDVNTRDDNGCTPLHRAAWHDHSDVVKLLLAHNASQHISDFDGFTALMDACVNGKAESVEILLEHGANPWTRSHDLSRATDECLRGQRHFGTRAPDREYTRALKHVLHYMNHVWHDGGPSSLSDLCIFWFKRNRSKVCEKQFVDTIPDAMVAEHFGDWDGAARWL